jgi:hypothetical protein
MQGLASRGGGARALLRRGTRGQERESGGSGPGRSVGAKTRGGLAAHCGRRFPGAGCTRLRGRGGARGSMPFAGGSRGCRVLVLRARRLAKRGWGRGPGRLERGVAGLQGSRRARFLRSSGSRCLRACGLEDCAADNGNCGKRRKLQHGSLPVRPRETPRPNNGGVPSWQIEGRTDRPIPHQLWLAIIA